MLGISINTMFLVDYHPMLLFVIQYLNEEECLPAELKVCAFDKSEFVKGNSNALQHSLNDLLIVLHPELQQLPWSLHVV